MNFNQFNFHENLQNGLDAMGFSTPTPIQAEAIPIILAKTDLIACAQTGTGKTAAFLLPILSFLSENPTDDTNTLIIVPTRELAIQIDQVLQGFSYFTSVTSIAVYGGSNGQVFEQEKKALSQGANIIIATPGRLMAHLNMGYVKFDKLEHLILDEADRMLDMGFVDDIYRIIKHLPAKRQTLMFSATMAPSIRNLANKLLVDPKQIALSIAKPAAGVTQTAYVVYNPQKNALIVDILKDRNYSSVIVFCGTKESVKVLNRELQKAKFQSLAIHSDLEQNEREETLMSFRGKKTKILVATDVLSRGIDIDDIELVLNYDVPGDAADYVHRVGRTARAASKGEAITFINEREQKKFLQIETLIEAVIPKVELPADIGPGPEYAPEKQKDQPAFKKKKPFNKNKKPVGKT